MSYSKGCVVKRGVRSNGIFTNYCLKYYIGFDGVFVIYACFTHK
jgi:hypothetical protein